LYRSFFRLRTYLLTLVLACMIPINATDASRQKKDIFSTKRDYLQAAAIGRGFVFYAHI